MTPHQMNLYQLADNLGMTVTRMTREMTMSEYYGWLMFYGERAEQAEQAEREAKKGKRKLPKPSRDGEVILQGFDL